MTSSVSSNFRNCVSAPLPKGGERILKMYRNYSKTQPLTPCQTLRWRLDLDSRELYFVIFLE